MVRQIAVLRLIPRHPRKIAVTEIYGRFANAGYDVTVRTIQRDLISLGGACIVVLPVLAAAQTYAGKTWERIRDPQRVGWSVADLKKAKDYSATIQTATVMVILDGRVLDEWGRTATRFNVHSIRKSFLSSLYGIHISDRRRTRS